MPRKRLSPKARQEEIIKAFIHCATESGYNSVTRRNVAERLGISDALVTRYFKDSMHALKRDALQYAIENGHKNIIAQALVIKDPLALQLDEATKKDAIKNIL